MPSKHAHATEDLHFRVLRLLQDDPQLSQRELARRLGISFGKANYCLRALVDAGLVKLGNLAHSRHPMGYAYLLTPAGMAKKAALTGCFLQRKMAEYEALRAEIDGLRNETRGAIPD
jgi:EPS-associated MarR family transcriptional regulator